MQRIEEIYWLRAYGCLAVFSFHLLDYLNQRVDTLATDLARIPTVLGTPIFIFISIFLFSMRYGRDIPQGFLGSRVKYVMVPYLVYGLAYSLAEFLRLQANGVEAGLVETLREYLVYAGWHGYFLIIAAQFYAFYWLYGRFDLARWLPATPWLLIGSLIGMAWWGYWQWRSSLPPGYLHWIAPLGWLYLFFLAMVLVKHYQDTPEARPAWLVALARPRWLVALIGLVVLLSLPGWLEYSSKEVWVVPFFLLFTLWIMGRLRGRPAPPTGAAPQRVLLRHLPGPPDVLQPGGRAGPRPAAAACALRAGPGGGRHGRLHRLEPDRQPRAVGRAAVRQAAAGGLRRRRPPEAANLVPAPPLASGGNDSHQGRVCR
ncbi:acyltransferase family protein [Halomonas sp. PGE1]|uniref:acyltransferase family protein n=1 Tax=Halomonas sp. PGE1 TaxID=2730360 RepID=UPI0032D57702